jgi:hypothetical protein
MNDSVSLTRIDKSKIYILKKYNNKSKKFNLNYVRLKDINHEQRFIGNIYHVKFKTISGKSYYFKNVQQWYNGKNCYYYRGLNINIINKHITHFTDLFKPNMIYKLYESVKIGIVHKKTVVELTKNRLPEVLIEYIQEFV